jgi:methylaspartate mutase sigma subunit
VIGSLNGHVHEDLRELRQARAAGQIGCPVIVGGNLSVGSHKDESAAERLHELGVDHILDEPGDLPGLLDRLRAETERQSRTLSRVS